MKKPDVFSIGLQLTIIKNGLTMETIKDKLAKIQSKYLHLMDSGNIYNHIHWNKQDAGVSQTIYPSVTGLPLEVCEEILNAYKRDV